MKLSGDWFREWFNSPYYHQLYAHRDDKEAAHFIEHLLGYLKPPRESRLFDIACGRGRHARILASRGFDVTGIDIAPDNIAFAKKFETNKLHFYVHDMRLPCWINYFHIAFNFFTSFGYFNTDREDRDAMRSIAQSLMRKGVFVMDYLNVKYTEEHLVPNSDFLINGVQYQCRKWFDQKHFYKHIEIDDQGARKTLAFTERVTKFSLADFKKLFTSQGLNIVETFGDYALNTYIEDTSPRLIMIANKG